MEHGRINGDGPVETGGTCMGRKVAKAKAVEKARAMERGRAVWRAWARQRARAVGRAMQTQCGREGWVRATR